ncbi:glycosyltransferase family 2 protein [Dyadobacter diqingensis]|uniref:glycosyltransferase family 2 protein n=1 Tax=Dyadobacter diqingensis TaxID=2938121 RepID=UPI0020C1B853|nr:glycosyltransferase family 2 protein [Dyadobacter diqingensis]
MNHYNTLLISICIPAYKNPTLLKRCLNTVLEQTYSNIEVIITDDSPNEDVANVVKKYNDPRIIYIKNAIPLGSPENWNEGLRRSKGEFIKIMHHDDWFANKDALRIFVETALKTGSDFICSNCFNVHPDRKEKHSILKRFQKKWLQDPTLILYANYVGNPSTTFFKRQTDQPVFFDQKSIWFVDVLFYYDYTRLYPKVAFIDEYLIDTSAGLDTQITNSAISAKIAIGEFVYMCIKYNLNRTHKFLTILSMIELMKRHEITSKEKLSTLIENSNEIQLPYPILQLPISHQVFNVLKHLIILI